jgi:hypothetical protein
MGEVQSRFVVQPIGQLSLKGDVTEAGSRNVHMTLDAAARTSLSVSTKGMGISLEGEARLTHDGISAQGSAKYGSERGDVGLTTSGTVTVGGNVLGGLVEGEVEFHPKNIYDNMRTALQQAARQLGDDVKQAAADAVRFANSPH